MENASKALLIAGAILICILLIGVGMLVYTSSQGTITGAMEQMSTQERDMFNSQFTQYEGSRVNGSQVRALLRKVNSNNSTYTDVTEKQVKVTSANPSTGKSAITSIVTTGTPLQVPAAGISGLNTAASYEVVVSDTNNDGLVDSINIVKYGN